MSRVQGFALALGSVGLVSAAQLGMRWSMTRLPQPNEWLTASIDLGALGVVVLAILAYVLLRKGMADLKPENLMPTRTVENVQRDAHAVKEAYHDA